MVATATAVVVFVVAVVAAAGGRSQHGRQFPRHPDGICIVRSLHSLSENLAIHMARGRLSVGCALIMNSRLNKWVGSYASA